MKVYPTKNNFLARNFTPKLESKLQLSEEVAQQFSKNIAIVEETGPDCNTVKKGDIIFFPIQAADSFMFKGEILMICNESLVKAILNINEEGFETIPTDIPEPKKILKTPTNLFIKKNVN